MLERAVFKNRLPRSSFAAIKVDRCEHCSGSSPAKPVGKFDRVFHVLAPDGQSFEGMATESFL